MGVIWLLANADSISVGFVGQLLVQLILGQILMGILAENTKKVVRTMRERI